MTIPAAFSTALASRANTAIWFLEISGIPYAFGTSARSASFFTQLTSVLDTDGNAIAARTTAEQFAGVLPWIVSDPGKPFDPQLSEQRVDYFEGRVNIQSARIVLLDHDDTLAGYCGTRRTSNLGLLTADLTPSSTSIPYSGATFDASGTVYVGAETIAFTSNAAGALGGLTRGLYKSRAQAHTGSVARGAGEFVSTYPRGLEGRACWLWYGLDCDTDARTAVCVFAGYIRATGWQNAGRELVLQIEDNQSRTTKEVFTDLSTTLLARDGEGPARLYAPREQTNASNETQTVVYSDNARAFSDGESICVFVPGKDGDQVVRIVRDSTRDAGTDMAFVVSDLELTRGAATGVPESFPAQLVAFIGDPDRIGDATKFTQGNHPLQVALQILMSSGTAGANGTYDVLPEAWGCGLTEDDVDVAAFEILRKQTENYRITLPAVKSEPAREFIIRECMRPFGFFLRLSFDSKLSVGRMTASQPTIADGAPEITVSDLAVDRGGRVIQCDGPVAQMDRVIGSVKWSDSPYLAGGKLEFPEPITFYTAESVAQLAEFPNAQSIEMQAGGVHWRHGGRTGEIAAPGERQGKVYAGDFVAMLATRYGRPPGLLTVALATPWLLRSGAPIEVGDVVTVTLTFVPDTATGTRGIAQVPHEVVSKRWDVTRGCVIFGLARTGVGAIETRYVAPSAEVTGWNAGTKTIAVAANAFSESPAHDTDAFTAHATTGDKVRVYSPDHGSRSGLARIVSKTGTTLVLDVVPTTRTPTAGDFVELADYDDATATMKSNSAYAADAAETLGTAVDAANVYD